MVIKVRSKKEFAEKCSCFKSPVLIHGSYGELLSHDWIVKDKSNMEISVVLPGCRVSEREYQRITEHAGDFTAYYMRRDKAHAKYLSWMHYVFGYRFEVRESG